MKKILFLISILPVFLSATEYQWADNYVDNKILEYFSMNEKDGPTSSRQCNKCGCYNRRIHRYCQKCGAKYNE